MDKKEIRFSSVIDTKEFDRAVEAMQKKLQSVYQASDRSRAQLEVKQAVSKVGLGAAPTIGEKAKADQEEARTRRELDKFIKDQVKEQERLGKEIQNQIKLKKELGKLAKEDYDSAVKLLEVEKQLNTNREKMKASQEATMRALHDRQRPGYDGFGGIEGAFQRGAAAYNRAGAGGVKGFGNRLAFGAAGFGRGIMSMGPLAMAGMAGSVIGAGLGAFGSIDQSFNLAQRQVLSAQGSARADLGSGAARVLNRQGLEDVFYATETAEATKKAEEEIKRTRRNDLLKLTGAAIGAVAGAALSLTGVGASIGVPMMAAGASLFSANYMREQVVDRMTGKYEAGLAEQRISARQQNLESMKNLDPVRRATFERYQKEIMPNLAAQRATGLSDDELKSTLQMGAEAGFTTDLTRQSMQNILAAGGSTRGARENATTANILERNFNLTNASTALGRLSGLSSSTEQTNSVMVKVLAEGMSIGLDKSQFAQEQRRFVDLSTEIIARTGATDEGAQRSLAEGFSQFVRGPEAFQLEGAKGAYEMVNRVSGEMGGARGAIKAAAINRDTELSNLNRDERNYLLGLTDEQIRAGKGDPVFEGLAASAGITVEKFQKKALGINKQSLTTRADTDAAAAELRKMREEGKEGTEEYKSLESKYFTSATYDIQGARNLKPEDKKSFIETTVFGGKSPADFMQENEVRLKAAEGPATAGDKYIEGQAAQDKAFLETVDVFKASFDDANAKLGLFSEEIVKAATALKNIDPKDMEGLAKAAKVMAEIYAKIGVTAPQGNDLVVQPKGGPTNE